MGICWQCLTHHDPVYFCCSQQWDASRQNKRTLSSLFVPVFKGITRPKDFLKRTGIFHTLATIYSLMNIAHKLQQKAISLFACLTSPFWQKTVHKDRTLRQSCHKLFNAATCGIWSFWNAAKLKPHSKTVQSNIAYFVHGFCIQWPE